MHSELDIAWLAGLLDGEGCIAFMRRTDYAPNHRLEVRYDVKLAMSCEETIGIAYEMIAEIVGDDSVKMYEERRSIRRRRPLWRCDVSSKQAVFDVLSRLVPYMRTKNTEAQLCLDYLSRARHHKRYRATDYDRRLADLATGIRNGCREARVEAKEILGQVILSQAAEDIGSAEGAETRRVSSNNNPAHERPAPYRTLCEGEDIVRSPRETSGEGINDPRPMN